jgi:hypothetical protein
MMLCGDWIASLEYRFNKYLTVNSTLFFNGGAAGLRARMS